MGVMVLASRRRYNTRIQELFRNRGSIQVKGQTGLYVLIVKEPDRTFEMGGYGSIGEAVDQAKTQAQLRKLAFDAAKDVYRIPI
jgi:hypothetical protein